MLSINELVKFYPPALQKYERFIIREYLQYKILEIVFSSEYRDKLAFLGGTCLRLVHGNTRFSEDLDFDNFDLSMDDFNQITDHVQNELVNLGFEIEMRNVEKGAFHCYIRFPELLFSQGISGHKEEKILIQLDTEPHNYLFKTDQPILNKFDVFTQINSTPLSLLLAQKFYAVVNRKRNKGRDFFDIVFLMAQGVKPDYDYLNQKIEVSTPVALKQRILEKCATLDMQEMADDVRPFLFSANEDKKVLLFPQYMEQVKLG